MASYSLTMSFDHHAAKHDGLQTVRIHVHGFLFFFIGMHMLNWEECTITHKSTAQAHHLIHSPRIMNGSLLMLNLTFLRS